MRIGFVRHGQTKWNEAGRAQGHSDIPLNMTGKREAHLIGKRLAQEDWDLVFSSDLLRAKNTAEIIVQQKHLPHIIDERLRERHGGKIEGTTEAERIEKWGESWRSLNLGIETGEQMSERGLDFLEEMIPKYYPKNLLIVSHGAFLKQLLRTLTPEENVEASLANCSLTILKTTKSTWELQLHNCLNHMR